MSADFLVELGTEELPPKALKSLSNAFTDGVVSGLRDLGLNYKDVRSFAAPRRLAITISELDAQTPNKDLVIWGPPVKVAFSDDGTPSKAAEAFAKKNGVTIKELASLIDNDGQQDKLCIRRTENGVDTKTCLADIINRSLAKLPIPRRMRWGYKKEEFVRPAQWAVLLFNDEVLHDSILGITASNTSRGHRFHANQEILIKSPSSYQQQLRDAYVIADFNQRRELITKGVESLAKEINGIAVLENDLLDEVAALNEWPVPLMGEFDEHFLSIPAQALISSMKEHQKYFHVLDAKDQLLPAFITVANIESTDPAQVIDGNERVIRPRLADAAFFYENDKKTTLKSRRSSLKNIVFQADLGSVYDKTQRVAAIAEYLADKMGGQPNLARRAAELSKSDLVTDMVGEFDDLQGDMGRDYALNDGEDKEVAEALFEQYLPRFSGDIVPGTITGAALALADRLDSLMGIFSIGQQPSGSRDPFALRRASLGVLRIILERNLDLDLVDILSFCNAQLNEGKSAKLSGKDLEKQVLTYILERFKAVYKEKGVKTEVFLSVATLGLSNPLDFDARVCAVHQFTRLPEASSLAAANKRVSNILAKQLADKSAKALVSDLLKETAEKQLANNLDDLEALIAPLLTKRDYNGILEKLAELKDPVDQFFEDVMVMTDDMALRQNRLALLDKLQKLFMNVADISQLVPAK
ncbi:MAG: glycine--tRNA ligase subunit beta [Cellvibrionales bacterium TMED47]|nr:glycine--tRNA ligase subunit beta [Porticoccaceae bacterium]RPG82173.1 MAG: glycine--tRNA ligase subunit beta [Cellvibrionales bacterium TMED47]